MYSLGTVKAQADKDTYQWENWKGTPTTYKQIFTLKVTATDCCPGINSMWTKKDYIVNTMDILEHSLTMVGVTPKLLIWMSNRQHTKQSA